MNRYWLALLIYIHITHEEKEKGIFSFASEPPKDDKYFITKLYDDLFPSWRTEHKPFIPLKKETNDAIVEEIKKISEAPHLKKEEVDFDVSNPDSMVPVVLNVISVTSIATWMS